MRVTIFDYGAGNLHSLSKALQVADIIVAVESDPLRAIRTDVLVLPGVGAFGAASERVAGAREEMRAAILNGLPTIGVCLGMQLLFDGSDEGAGSGLGVIDGRVTKLVAHRIPQIGWNSLETTHDPLFDAAPLGMAYYANSFVCRPRDTGAVIAWSTHEGDRFPAAVRRGNTVGVQFHPEKSSEPGVRLLHEFLAQARSLRVGS